MKHSSPIPGLLLALFVGQISQVYADRQTISAENIDPNSSNSDSTYLEQVIVTARKREEDPQSIPGQMTVFQSKALEQGRIESMEELFFLTPSLNYIVTSNIHEPCSCNNTPRMINAMFPTKIY